MAYFYIVSIIIDVYSNNVFEEIYNYDNCEEYLVKIFQIILNMK